MIRIILGAWLILTGSAHAARALDLAGLQPLSELVVEGENRDTVPHPVTVRVDDRPGADYADRINEERIMPPGRFILRLRLALLKTPRGRPLDMGAAFKAAAFASGQVTFAQLRLDLPPLLPDGVKGWYFGPAAAVPLQGFDSVVPGDPRATGPHVEQVERPGGDPVLAHGMRLTRFETRLPPGQWRLTLWTEDPGAWETLPPVLQQRIRANGSDLLLFNRNYAQWTAERYLAGRGHEADPAETPFTALAARRGGRVTGTVAVADDGQLVLELAGFPQTATHIAALTAEPADRTPAAEAAVEKLRAERFAENWPVLAAPPVTPPVDALTLTSPSAAVTAPGGLAVLRFQARAPAAMSFAAEIGWDGPALPVRLLWGQWRWRRPAANAAGLVFSAAHLRGDFANIPLRPDLGRPIGLVVTAGAPGIHRGTLRIGGASAPFSVEVLPVARPAPTARVGPFLGFAPHLLGTPEWSKDAARQDAARQAACDLDTLASLGLTAVTAPLDPDDLVAGLRATLKRFPAPVVAYETLRAYAARHQPNETAAMLARTNAAIQAAGLPPVTWSIADEPGYTGTIEDVRALAAAIHKADPAAQLAGHLNDPRDAALLPDLAMVTVNPGFGADAADIAALRARGLRPWLYNMPRLRLSAGAYLWRSGADGLLQWHARMPTADPFDPTDGREGDVQFLWPTPGVCAPPDLDEDLLTLAEGAEDLRWFAWLDRAASGDRDAAILRRALWREAPATANAAAQLPAGRPATWRSRIVALARKLSN